jgi:hypothetical protein
VYSLVDFRTTEGKRIIRISFLRIVIRAHFVHPNHNFFILFVLQMGKQDGGREEKQKHEGEGQHAKEIGRERTERQQGK